MQETNGKLAKAAWALFGAVGAGLGAAVALLGTERGRRALAPVIVRALLEPLPHGAARRAYAVGSAVHSGVPVEEAVGFLSPDFSSAPATRVEARSADGRFSLAGWELRAESSAPPRRWVVLAHGWRGFHGETDALAAVWRLLGWNVLSVDLRAHGASGGDWAGMGAPDADDVAVWARDVVRRHGEETEIVLHGHSMGAAAVVGAAASPLLPAQVRAVVADCSFTSAYAMFDEVARSAIPSRRMRSRLFETARAWLLEQGGYDLAEASPLARIRRARVPVLLFHGTADDFVPPWMATSLFDACGAPLAWLRFVEGAGHCGSMRRDPAAYFGTVEAFLDAVRNGAVGKVVL